MTTSLIPPIAAPITPASVLAALVPRGGATGEFALRLSGAVGMSETMLFGSGRAALAGYLHRLPATRGGEVAVPAYTCWSVPAAVVRAGLRVRLIDVDPATFDMEPRGIEHALVAPTVAIVAAHLFARSVDLAAIVRRVRAAGSSARVIEDAAQAWPDGADPVADAIVLSFGRGKPLPLWRGGALLGAAPVGETAPGPARGGWGAALALLAISLMGRPAFYRLPSSIPALGIGRTVYDPGFSTDRPFHRWQSRLGVRLLRELPALEAERTRNARRLGARVGAVVGARLPRPARGRGPLRLPVLADSRARRDALLAGLRRRGVGASAMYPGALSRIEALGPHLVNGDSPMPGADELADRLITLPVYPGLGERRIDRIAEAFEATWREAGP